MAEKEAHYRSILWLCRDCHDRLRDTPGNTRSGKKYNLWEAGRWTKMGECFQCHQWKLLTMYELDDLEARDYRRKAQERREYGRRKDTRARYRPRFHEDD